MVKKDLDTSQMRNENLEYSGIDIRQLGFFITKAVGSERRLSLIKAIFESDSHGGIDILSLADNVFNGRFSGLSDDLKTLEEVKLIKPEIKVNPIAGNGWEESTTLYNVHPDNTKYVSFMYNALIND